MPSARSRQPKTLREFEVTFPGVLSRYRSLRDACDNAGPLDVRTRELIKIGIEVARRRRGGLIAHIDRAKAAGATTRDIAHAILLALPLIGLPDVLDALVASKKRLG